jgi:hypothetical protein
MVGRDVGEEDVREKIATVVHTNMQQPCSKAASPQ